jgi:hypothetical protein
MIRLFAFLMLFVILFVAETSFFTALPFPVSTTPFIIVVAIFLHQTRGMTSTVWFIPLTGLLLDVLNLHLIPLELISYSIAGLVALGASHSLFSNRSFYGVSGVTFTTLGSLSAIELFILLFDQTLLSSDIAFEEFMSLALWRLVLGLTLLFLIYSAGRIINRFVKQQ